MILLDEIQQLIDLTRGDNAANLQQRQEELQDAVDDERRAYDTRTLVEQAEGLIEPTLKFANIEQITKEEMAETKSAFQGSVWAIVHHDQEWVRAMQDKGVCKKEDIEVEEAIVEAKFRDNKAAKKYAEQFAEIKTSHLFRQVAMLATMTELYMDQGYHNEALFDYLDREVTPTNANIMRVAAVTKAREEAGAEMLTVAVMELQAEQDEW